MPQYELGFIIHPEKDDTSVDETITKVTEVIKGLKGEVTKVDKWGRRQLAYPIKKQREGSYVFFQMGLPSDAIAKLDRNLKLSEDLLRFMIIKIEE